MSRPPPIQQRIAEFIAELRGFGLPIGVDQAASFAESVGLVGVLDRDAVYYAGRATLVNRQDSLGVYHQAFEQFWDRRVRALAPQKAPQAPRHRPEDFQRSSLISFMAEKARRGSKETELIDRTDTASASEWLQRKDFSRLTDDERRAVEHAMRGLRWEFSLRETRRLTTGYRGRILDHRETLRRAARLGGTVIELPRRARKQKRRPLVLIADISGSMELYSRIVLQFFHALSQELRDTEVFVFGVRLSRITEAFRLREVDAALDRVSHEVQDFAGGTRIAESLHTFRRVWGPRLLRRGAVVMIISDGCETDDADGLKNEVQALQRNCYRLIWLNPRLGQHRYEPRVRGMAAVLPYIDDFMPIHSFESLRQLRDHLARLPRRKRGSSEVSRRL